MGPNDKNKQERTARMQRKVLEHLMESGNVSYSCKRAGVSRETYYAWRHEDKVFARDATLAINYGKSFVNDLAHTQLIRHIQDGNMQAVRFQLVSCHEHYQPRKARAPAEEIAEPVTVIHIKPYVRPPQDLLPSPAPSHPSEEEFTPITSFTIRRARKTSPSPSR